MSGRALQTESLAFQVTRFQRVEDGAWDPDHPHEFHFTPTDRLGGNTRLWRLRFGNLRCRHRAAGSRSWRTHPR